MHVFHFLQKVKLINASSKIYLDNYQKNGEWEIVSTGLQLNEIYYGVTLYHQVQAVINLRRKFAYYLVNIVANCVIMSLLSLVMFLLPAESGEKISLGVSVLLSYSVFLLLLVESMPKISDYIPILSKFMSMFHHDIQLKSVIVYLVV